MKLYTHPISLYPYRVEIALHEKGLAYDRVRTDLGEGPSDAFLAINPFGQIPVLEHDGLSIAESMAILHYLEEKFPAPALTPSDVDARATMRQLMCWSSDYWYAHWREWLAPRFDRPWTEASLASAREGLCRHFDVMDRQLQGNEWLVGAYSLADI